MKKSFSIPASKCDSCGAVLEGTVRTEMPVFSVSCEACGVPFDFGAAGAEISDDLKEKGKSFTAVLSRSLVELRDTLPKSKEELSVAIRNPRHPFTATMLTGAALILMEMSGFGIFLVVSWILGNLILNPLGWVLIPAVVAIAFAYRRVFAREAFEKIRAQVGDLQDQLDQGEIAKVEFERMRDQVLAGAFDDVALEDALKDGDFDASLIKMIRSTADCHSPAWIWDKEHVTALQQAIRDTEEQLFVYSGWLGINVVDIIYDDLKAAIERGANVHIGYGWQSPSNPEAESDYEKRALAKLDELNKMGGKGCVRIKRFPNHSKLLVCDGKYVICGSANWLNNRNYHNREVSVRICDRSLVGQFLQASTVDFN